MISIQERHGAPVTGPAEGDKDLYGTQTSLMQEKVEGAGPDQPWEETTERGAYQWL